MPGSKLAIVGAGRWAPHWLRRPDPGSASNVALFDVNALKAEAEVLDLAHAPSSPRWQHRHGGGESP